MTRRRTAFRCSIGQGRRSCPSRYSRSEAKYAKLIQSAPADGIVQRVDVRDAAIVRDSYLAVEDDGAASVGQFCERRFEQRCAINAVPAQQLQPAIAADDGYEPVPVVLRLVEPVLSLRRLRAGRDDLQTDVARHARRNSVAWKRRR